MEQAPKREASDTHQMLEWALGIRSRGHQRILGKKTSGGKETDPGDVIAHCLTSALEIVTQDSPAVHLELSEF